MLAPPKKHPARTAVDLEEEDIDMRPVEVQPKKGKR
jgi:hypothetical protein